MRPWALPSHRSDARGPFETCNKTGCIALVTVDADTLEVATNQLGGQVTVARCRQHQTVTIPFSLNGFAAGYEDLQRAKARRTSVLGFLNR